MVCGISRYRGISRSIVLLLLNIMKPDGSCLEALKVVKTSTAMSVSEILNQFLEKTSTNLAWSDFFFLLSANTKNEACSLLTLQLSCK